jgi:hypothetical protein
MISFKRRIAPKGHSILQDLQSILQKVSYKIQIYPMMILVEGDGLWPNEDISK